MEQWYRFFRVLHTWMGITLGLLLLLISVTGTLLVWKEDYVRLTTVEAQRAFDPTPEALAEIAGAVEREFDSNEILQIQFATSDFPLTRVTLADTRYAYVDTDGNVVDQWVQNERWEEWLYDLHHRLLLEDFGLTLVGLAGIAMMVMVLAGVVTFWPLRRGFKPGLWPAGTHRTHLLATHRNVGIVIALPLLLSLLTGVLLAFPEPSHRWLVESFRGEEYSMDFAEHLDDISGNDAGDWLPAMRRALDTFPGSAIRSAQVPNVFSPYRIIGVQQPGELHPQGLSRVYIDAREGWMDIRIDSQAQNVSERVYNTAYPLHTGRVNGVFYKLLLTLVGIATAALGVLGLVCFVKNLRRGSSIARS